MAQVNVELGLLANTNISLNQANVRALAERPAGTISMNDLRGKSSSFTATISSNQTNLNLRTWALANGWNGVGAATITVGTGVYIYSTDTSVAGLTINGLWPGGISLVNNGYIMGKGADGAAFPYLDALPSGSAGGPAISLGEFINLTNNSYIGGGGGSGGGSMQGGGAGGGNGGYFTTGQAWTSGVGGGPGASGTDGTFYIPADLALEAAAGGPGGGGRIMPGSGGAGGSPYSYGSATPGRGGGSGGGGGTIYVEDASTGDTEFGGGGNGGSANNNGSAGPPNFSNDYGVGGGGGGWGASGGSGSGWWDPTNNKAGGVGGKAIALNGYTVTIITAGTIWGAIS